jgi:hypothetical protein
MSAPMEVLMIGGGDRLSRRRWPDVAVRINVTGSRIWLLAS